MLRYYYIARCFSPRCIIKLTHIQARASVDIDEDGKGSLVTLNEPSRPFTPAAMDARLSIADNYCVASRKYGSRDRLDPMSLRAEQRNTQISGRRPSYSEEPESEVVPSTSSSSSSSLIPEEFAVICRSLNDEVAAVSVALRSASADMARILMMSIQDSVEAMSKYIKKNPEIGGDCIIIIVLCSPF